MGNALSAERSLDNRMADRLKALRTGRGWSLEDLSKRCGISRATLSRLENAEVSPTASALGRLCPAYGLTMSRLMAMVEEEFTPLVPRDRQLLWEDPETGFRRRSVSPPAGMLGAELLECELPAGRRIEYSNPPRPGLEHHLYLLEGSLDMTIDGQVYHLSEGDCLRYQLYGPSLFETDRGGPARYVLAVL